MSMLNPPISLDLQAVETMQAELVRLRQQVLQLEQERDAAERSRQTAEAQLYQSQQVLQGVIDNIPQIIGWKDRESVFLGGNQRLAEVAGCETPTMIIGKTNYDLAWSREEADRYRAWDQRVMNSGQAELHILEAQQQADGTQTWLDTHKIPLRDRTGAVVGILFIIEDVTQRQQAAADRQAAALALAESEAKFRRLVEDAHDVIATWDLAGVITYISPEFEPMMGFAPTDWMGQSFASLVHSEDLPPWLAANQRVIETGAKQSDVEVRHQHQDGHWVWVAMNLSPVKDATGCVIGLQGVFRDITAAKQQADALRLVVEGTVAKTGADFFQTCVQYLVEVCQVKYAFIAERVDDSYSRSRMLALWVDGAFIDPYEFELKGTPCGVVFQETWGIFPDELQQRFPMASALATLNAESYLGVVVRDSQGQAIGNLGIIDTQPITDKLDTAKFILQIFAARVGAEMERYATEADLQEYADRQTLLNQLASQIRHSLDFDAVITTAIGAIRELLAIEVCAFAWYHPDPTSPYWEIIQEAKQAEIAGALGCYPAALVGPVEQIFLTQDLLCINAAEQYEEPIHREFLRMIGCQSELLVPIQTASTRIGVIICLQHSQVRPWTASEIELLKAVGNQLAIAIDQANLLADSRAKGQELQTTLQELQRTQAQMIQSEKMSSLGQLVAGVAHEINNPVNFIHGNLTHAYEYIQNLLDLVQLYQRVYPHPKAEILAKMKAIDLDFLQADLIKLLDSMNVGTDRIREIILSLRNFSRLDEDGRKAVNIHEGIDSTLLILQHRLKATAHRAEIAIHKNYSNLPLVHCYAGRLNQVFMNILTNAIDAIDSAFTHANGIDPNIIISTQLIGDHDIEITIHDNGRGIPAALQQRLFDPFFTTKPVGQGTGMGLSISYQIIQQHRGKIGCESIPGSGATFVIKLPVQFKPQPSLI